MQSKNGNKSKKVSAKGIPTAVLISIAATIVMLLIAAALIEAGKIKEQGIGTIVIIINVLAGLICGAVSKAAGRGGGALNGIISGAVYATVIVLLAVLLDFQLTDKAQILRIYAVSVLSAFAGCKINLAKSNKKFHKKHKT